MINTSGPLRRGVTSLLQRQAPASRSFSSIAPRLSSTTRPRVNAITTLYGKRFTATAADSPVPASSTSTVPTVDFDPHAVTSMDKMDPPQPGEDFNVVIVGA